MTNDFKSRLSFVADRMETVLDSVLPQPTGPQQTVMEAARYAALGGGKRLRPFLMVETARMLGHENDAIWDVAAALECLHVYSLVHDDLPCMDDDDLRRGKPTVHKAYDEALAVLAGDALLTHAFQIIAEADFPDAVKVSLISKLGKAGGMHGMIGGQVVDITVNESERDEALITQLQDMKTGALIRYAVEAGAIMGGATAAQMESLISYADAIGLAFQIKDDILDVEGDAALVGKAVQKDTDKGKVTFVSILGLDAAKVKAHDIGQYAKNNLLDFGAKADILIETVDFILNRQS
ncbi:MAG: polyprenyl synthetase family protein [Maricaulaceae bacterium]